MKLKKVASKLYYGQALVGGEEGAGGEELGGDVKVDAADCPRTKGTSADGKVWT